MPHANKQQKPGRYVQGFASMQDMIRERSLRQKKLDDFEQYVDELIERADKGTVVLTTDEATPKVLRAVYDRLRENKAYFLVNSRNRDWLMYFRRPSANRQAA